MTERGDRERPRSDSGTGEPREDRARRAAHRRLRRLLTPALALLPWGVALYLLYTLEQRELWQADQPLRAAASVTILALGMALSFLLHSRLRGR